VSYQFTDVTGVVKSVDAPVKRLEEALDDGVWFDGSYVEGFARIQESGYAAGCRISRPTLSFPGHLQN